MNANKHALRCCETCRWYIYDWEGAACGNFHTRFGAVRTARDFECEGWEEWTHEGEH